MIKDQKHLSYKERVNLGGYYTKPEIVALVYYLITKNIESLREYSLLDTSCGYGSFFEHCKLPNPKIGADIDQKAILNAKNTNKNVDFFTHNSLLSVDRKKYKLSPNQKLIIIGNPPYNDTTSIIRNNIKQNLSESIDEDLKTRDLGMSFILSYDKLQADYICILHPLSYLIKKTNFYTLKNFTKNYTLIDSVIISSEEFTQTSRTTSFPIIIALYKKCNCGMTYEFIERYNFKTKENKLFKLSNYDTIARYITKYPNQKYVSKNEAVAKFWTMRDINALKRSRTFVEEISTNTILVTANKLDYYCYVDIFKKFIPHIPYYFGNCDIMIDHQQFLKLKDCFRYMSLNSHPNISARFNNRIEPDYQTKVNHYFRNLLGEHYVY